MRLRPSSSEPAPMVSELTWMTRFLAAGTRQLASSASPSTTLMPSGAMSVTRKRLSPSCSEETSQPFSCAMRVRFWTATSLSTRVSTVPAPPREARAFKVLTTGMGHASPTASTCTLFAMRASFPQRAPRFCKGPRASWSQYRSQEACATWRRRPPCHS